jgi:hypothetical protein
VLAPYSQPGSSSSANCTNCASGCTSGTYGRILQAAPVCNSPWTTLWLDAQGVEGNHSCLRYIPTSVSSFSAASAACTGTPANNSNGHLVSLSTKQVRASMRREWLQVYVALSMALSWPHVNLMEGVMLLPKFASQTTDMSPATGSDLLSTAWRMVTPLPSPLPASLVLSYLAASRSPSSGSIFSGWSWIDGIPSSNLACDSAGCSVFTPGDPK